MRYQPLDINELNIRVPSKLDNTLKKIKQRLKEVSHFPKTKSKSQEYCTIIRELKVLNHNNPDNPSVRKLLGNAYFKLGQLFLRYQDTLQIAIDKLQKAKSFENPDAEVALRFIDALLLPAKEADNFKKSSTEHSRHLIFSNILTPSPTRILEDENKINWVLNAARHRIPASPSAQQ